jgi:hypothetical protein
VLGFGQNISWKDHNAIPPGHKMSFKESLHTVSTDVVLKLVFPTFAMRWTAKTRKCNLAFEELEVSAFCTQFRVFALTKWSSNT